MSRWDCSREGKAWLGWGCAMSSSWLCSCSAHGLASGFSNSSALWLYLESNIKKLLLHPEGFKGSPSSAVKPEEELVVKSISVGYFEAGEEMLWAHNARAVVGVSSQRLCSSTCGNTLWPQHFMGCSLVFPGRLNRPWRRMRD